MDRALLFSLLLLPGLAQAVICKTVGADGEVSFSDVPAAECPQGSRIPDYRQAAPQAERAGAVDTGVSARQVKFAGYDSIEIVSPEDGGTVRSNEGRVPVLVKLEPGLQQSHFITAYLDGMAHKGRYGSTEVIVTGVERGTHRLNAKVSDSKGKTLIKSKTSTFTLHRTQPDAAITVDPITGDDYIDTTDPLIVRVTGTSEVGPVTLRFPASGSEYGPSEEAPPEVGADGVETTAWEILVPRSVLEGEVSFYAEAQKGRYSATSTHSVASELFTSAFRAPPDDPTTYSPRPPADFTNPGGGISTTPGQTNPAFNPSYKAN